MTVKLMEATKHSQENSFFFFLPLLDKIWQFGGHLKALTHIFKSELPATLVPF